MLKSVHDLRSGALRLGATQAAPLNAASRRVRSSAQDLLTEINIQRVAGNWSRSVSGYKSAVLLWCNSALDKRAKGAVSIVLADDAFVQGLNHQYRGKNKPTNVLSFPGNEAGELGDIVLAYETIKREAAEQNKSFRAHTAHMIVHGVLHLQGFDHEEDADAEKMERKEIAILKELGFANPYEVKYAL